MATIPISEKSSTTSSFYYACRNGLIDEVREKLQDMPLEEVDRVQANGSTALHAACYYGHTEIVKLLLDKGASRSIENKHQCLPYDEAEKSIIKTLFKRDSSTRFSDEDSGHIDWIKCDDDAEKLAKEYRYRHTGFGWTSKNTAHRMKHIKEEMSHTDQEQIRGFLERAHQTPTLLLKAYTVESSFYRTLNKDLAAKHFEQGTNFGLTYFIDFFYNHPDFAELSYKGKVYRGMTITHDDLTEYGNGKKIMSKAFMSTTINHEVAKAFAKKNAISRGKQHGDLVKISVLCMYEIINDRTGLFIEKLSEYRDEQEVLVGPYSAFMIQAIRRIQNNYAEIDLRECEKPKDEDSDDDSDDD